jgi:hypothetical protein
VLPNLSFEHKKSAVQTALCMVRDNSYSPDRIRYSKEVGIGYRSLRCTEEGSGALRSENAWRAVKGAAGFMLAVFT